MSILWLPLAILSYLLQAINGAVDRIIVHQQVTKPVVISFWVAIFSGTTLGLLLIGLLPLSFAETFRLVSPDVWTLFLVLVAGIFGQAGLLYMYKALEFGEATRVLSLVGAATPIVTLATAFIFLGERLGLMTLAAFGVLVFGAVVLSGSGQKTSTNATWIWMAILSSVLLAFQTVLAKYIFDTYHFISAFALMSLGALLFGGWLALVSHDVREQIKDTFWSDKKVTHRKNQSKQAKQNKQQIIWVIGNSALGGVAVIILNLAIKLGSPSLVSALRGVQYAGVFLIAIGLSHKLPQLLDEELTRKALTQKISGILLITVGVALLALA